MANDNFMDITEVDFESIKNNFKEYLRSKPKFNGYDFEGSSMNILMDILAYNTHYAAFYANMVGNEMFMDSATKRDSVVSHAKMLNYVPKSITSAKAVVNIRRNSSSTVNRGDYAIGRYINDNNQNISTVFTFLQDYEFKQISSTEWIIENAVLSEGILQTLTYVYDNRLREKKFLIPNNADISTVRVKIRQSAASADDDTETWTRAIDFSMIGSEEKIYFLQAAYDGQYEIYFGDGILGKSLNNGALIYIEYLLSSGENGNYYTSFSFPGGAVDTVSIASGGSSAEDIVDIRKNAFKAFSAQNRSVTSKDYESSVLEVFPQAESVKVWGGEENQPPQFGKVFISIKPNGALYASDVDKRTIVENIRTKAVVGIVPEIVDPEFIYGILTVNTSFNPSKTPLSRSEISVLQKKAIMNYFDEVLEKFDSPLYVSKLNKILDEVDGSILGTQIKTMIEQRIRPSTIYPTFVDIKFYNRIYHPYEGHKGGVRSSLFSYKNSVGEIKEAYVEDNGYGKLSIVTGQGANKKFIIEDAGEVDYNTGNMTIFEFKPVNFGDNDHIKIRIMPESNDIFVMKNKIITTTVDSIYVEVLTKDETERIMRGASRDFVDYLNERGRIPDGPIVVPTGTNQSMSIFSVPNLPPSPPLPNSVPITIPSLGRIGS